MVDMWQISRYVLHFIISLFSDSVRTIMIHLTCENDFAQCRPFKTFSAN